MAFKLRPAQPTKSLHDLALPPGLEGSPRNGQRATTPTGMVRSMQVGRAIAVIAVIGGCALGVLPQNSAISESAPAQVDPAAVALSQAQGVSLTDASERISRQAAQSALVDALSATYPSSFAGAWIDQANAGRLIIRFVSTPTDLASLLDQFGLAGNVLVGEPATFSLATLDSLQSSLDNSLRGAKYASAVDPKVNELVFRGAPGGISASLLSIVNQLVADHPGVMKVVLNDSTVPTLAPASSCAEDASAEPGCSQPFRGGQKITIGSAGGEFCTLGFSTASDSDSKPYSITAGHCLADIPVGTAIYALNGAGQTNPYAANWNHSFVVNSSHDWGIVALNSGLQQEGDVYVQATSGSRPTTRNENYAINGVSGTIVGDFYCKSGASGGTACGQVDAVGVTNTSGSDPITNLAEVGQGGTGHYTCKGDSGGPVYAGNRGVGLVQSIDVDAPAGTAPNGQQCFYIWYYVSLNSALNDMHVHLVSP